MSTQSQSTPDWQLRIEQSMYPFSGSSNLPLTLTSTGVNFSIAPDYRSSFIPWEEVADVEKLSQRFNQLRVFEFEALCKGLAVALSMKDHVPAILQQPTGFDGVFMDSILHPERL